MNKEIINEIENENKQGLNDNYIIKENINEIENETKQGLNDNYMKENINVNY